MKHDVVHSCRLLLVLFRVIRDPRNKSADAKKRRYGRVHVAVGVLVENVEVVDEALAAKWQTTYVSQFGAAVCVAADATLEDVPPNQEVRHWPVRSHKVQV